MVRSSGKCKNGFDEPLFVLFFTVLSCFKAYFGVMQCYVEGSSLSFLALHKAIHRYL